MKNQTDHNDTSWNNCVCPVCGKAFHLKPYHIKRVKTKPCCSKKCLYEYKKTLMSGEGNHQYGLKGSKNASWKSDRHISRFGYWQVRCLDHPFRDKQDFVFEHRLVAEQHLLTDENSVEIDGKRYLSPEYVVHHIDFNRLNNDPENLVVMTKQEHQRFHAKLNPRKTDPKTGRFVSQDELLKAKKITPTAIFPKRASSGAACYDLYVDTEETVRIAPHQTYIFQTNVSMAIPREYCGLIFARSGISTKRYLRPSTCVSVIDSDYRGSVGLPIHNDSDDYQFVQPHERVAQLMIVPAVPIEIELVDELPGTERGAGGFGSTGTD